MKYSKCLSCGNRAAWTAVWVNVALVLLKGIFGATGKSQGLVADAFHSGADVVIATVVLVALRIGGNQPDREHPYGHGKAEFIAASLVTVALLAAVIFLFKSALDKLGVGVPVKPSGVTFFVALISVAANEWLFRLNMCAGKALKSPALVANAWHGRYDAYLSGVVALGILGAMAGFKSLDPVAALIVGVVIVKIAIDIFRGSYKGLMDTALPAGEKRKIENAAGAIAGVNRVVSVNGRRMGQKLWVDLCIELMPSCTVSQSFAIGERIKETILFKVENIEDVQIETESGIQKP